MNPRQAPSIHSLNGRNTGFCTSSHTQCPAHSRRSIYVDNAGDTTKSQNLTTGGLRIPPVLCSQAPSFSCYPLPVLSANPQGPVPGALPPRSPTTILPSGWCAPSSGMHGAQIEEAVPLSLSSLSLYVSSDGTVEYPLCASPLIHRVAILAAAH